jgi:long-chain acyl-CoA synthetase
MRLVQHYLIEAAQRFPEKPALICDNKRFSYAQIIGRMHALSAILLDGGLQKGDRALVLLADKSDFLLACYSVMEAGGIAVPLSEGFALPAIEEIAHNCLPSILITSRQDLADFPLLRDRLSCSFLLIENSYNAVEARTIVDAVLFDADRVSGSEDQKEAVAVGEDDGAMILFTSGPRCKKKGILLSHRNLVEATSSINEFMRVDPGIRELVAVPLTHSFGFGRSRCVHFVGGTMVVNNGSLNPVALIQSVLKHQCDAISSVPSGFAVFFGRLESLLRGIGPQVHFIELGGAFMPLDHKLKLLEIFPKARIFMHYGLAEAPRSTCLDFRQEQRKLHTVGRALPRVSLSIGDDLGRRLGRMEMGEIFVRGDHVAARYWNDVELNTQCYTADGWFKTGDYGYLDEEGYLHLLGRKDDMINMGDVKISPLEVEEKIHELYPDCEIYVVGVPDPAGIVGEIPVLCYAAKEGVTITPSDLARGLASRLDRNKIPSVIYRIENLPKVESGKLMRRELRKKIIIGSIHEAEHVH